METITRETDLATVLRAPLRSVSDEVILVTDDSALVAHVVTELSDLGADAPEEVQLLSTATALDEALGQFFTATRAAELAEGRLDLRTAEAATLPSVFITPDELVTVVSLPGDRAVSVETADDAVVRAVRSAYLDAFDGAAEYHISQPPYSELLAELESRVGDGTRDDLDQIVQAGLDVRSSREGLDEVELAILLGARNGAMLMDLARWAEDTQVASRSTMSNRKRELEEKGLITTEDVVHGVGRPKQRLGLTEKLESLEPADVVRTAQDVLEA